MGKGIIWLRAETRPSEARTPLMPDGARKLREAGFDVTVESSPTRIVPDDAYASAGCPIVPTGSWPDAPAAANILGLKELPETDRPLHHRHIYFAHAYKGQPGAEILLDRFRRGGGALYDLEYLVDAAGRRVAAFGYYAGYVGAALSVLAYAAQRDGGIAGPVRAWSQGAASMVSDIRGALRGARPDALVIGAKGRVGSGAADLLGRDLGLDVTRWDQEETASGGPFPQVARHAILINAVLAMPGIPVFVDPALPGQPRDLRVIGDVACDPGTPYNPVPVYDRVTSWEAPVTRVHDAPPLDVMAIDNLPSLLPREASEEFAAALLPHLLGLDAPETGVWGRAAVTFARHLGQ